MSRKFLVLLIFVTLVTIGFSAAADNTTDDVVAADDSDEILEVSDANQEILSKETSTDDDSDDMAGEDLEPKDYLYDFVFFHPKKLTTTYNSGKTFKVKVLSNLTNNQPLVASR